MKVATLLFLLLGCSSLHAQESDRLVEFSAVFPFPCKGGWTFRGDSLETRVFPVYDSVLFAPDYCFSENPFIVRNEAGKYGIIQLFEKADTLRAFDYDSAFCYTNNLLLRKGGNWVHLTYYESGLVERTIGSVDSWQEEGDHLYFRNAQRMGAISGKLNRVINPGFPYMRFFQSVVERQFTPFEYTPIPTYLVSDGKRFGLYAEEDEMIPVEAGVIQFYKESFIRYWNGYWKYLRLKDGFLIDPKGGRVVIYNADVWKIYDTLTQKATLFLNSNGSQMSGAYDDYFWLGNDRIAVTKDSLVGIITVGGELLMKPMFEQVNYLCEQRYAALEKGKWYLVDEQGNRLNKEWFHHLFPLSRKAPCIVVTKGNKSGIISIEGQILFAPKYDGITFWNRFVILKYNNGLAIGTVEGKLLTGHDFKAYETSYLNSTLFVVVKNANDQLFILNEQGVLNSKPCREYFVMEGLIKCYSEQGLELIVLDSVGKIEERQFYPGIQSFTIKNKKWNDVFVSNLGDLPVSVLEENQLNGLFGYRYTGKSGFLERPIFTEVFHNNAFNTDFAITTYRHVPFQHPLDSLIQLQSINTYRIVDPDGGTIGKEEYAVTDYNVPKHGGYSSANRIGYTENNAPDWMGAGGHDFLAKDVLYLNQEGNNVYAHLVQGKLDRPDNNEASLSVYELMKHYRADQQIVVSEDQVAAYIDPWNRYVFRDPKWYVQRELSEFSKISPKMLGQQYDHLQFIGSNWLSDNWYYVEDSKNQLYRIGKIANDTLGLNDHKLLDEFDSESVLVSRVKGEIARVHPLEPDFAFVQRDPSLQYHGGRLVRKINQKWKVENVSGEAIVPQEFDSVRYLGNGWYAGMISGKWLVFSRDGVVPVAEGFDLIGANAGNAISIASGGKWQLYDSLFQLKATADFPWESLANTIFRSGNLIYDLSNCASDSLLAEENYLGNDWFYGKVKGKFYLRKMGESELRIVKCDQRPELFGEVFILRKKGLVSLLNSEANALFGNKKWNDIVLQKDFFAVKSEKEWCILSPKGELLHQCPKGKSLTYYQNCFVVEQKDTTYAIDHFGNTHQLTSTGIEGAEELVYVEANNEVFSDGEGFGVRSTKGNILVASQFEVIIGKDAEEFQVVLPPAKGIWSVAKQDFIIPAEYDDIKGLGRGFFLVKNQRSFGIINVNKQWFVPLSTL